MAMRRVIGALVSLLALGLGLGASACSLPRDVHPGETMDAALPDARVELDARIPDAARMDGDVAQDGFVVPLDGFVVPMDGFVVPPDGFVVPPDGFVPTDAFVPRDAAVDPCAIGPDSDGDGTRDGCDRCPGSDDRVDVDSDGAPDGCDAWPCGATAPSVPGSVTEGGIVIDGVAIAGMGNVAVVARGASVSLSLDYSIVDCVCTGCIDQIEVGWTPGSRLFCAYDGNPRCASAATGTSTRTLTAPAVPGTYDLRFQLAQDNGCNHGGRTDWWIDPPAASGRIGIVCVR